MLKLFSMTPQRMTLNLKYNSCYYEFCLLTFIYFFFDCSVRNCKMRPMWQTVLKERFPVQTSEVRMWCLFHFSMPLLSHLVQAEIQSDGSCETQTLRKDGRVQKMVFSVTYKASYDFTTYVVQQEICSVEMTFQVSLLTDQ